MKENLDSVKPGYTRKETTFWKVIIHVQIISRLPSRILIINAKAQFTINLKSDGHYCPA